MSKATEEYKTLSLWRPITEDEISREKRDGWYLESFSRQYKPGIRVFYYFVRHTDRPAVVSQEMAMRQSQSVKEYERASPTGDLA